MNFLLKVKLKRKINLIEGQKTNKDQIRKNNIS